MKIAVIDDEKYSRMELSHQIKSLIPDSIIKEASNGVGAVKLLESESFDVLFIDIHLGDMEGTTLASVARKLMPEAKIIFATAYSEYAVKAFELQVDDYILKPFDPQRIAQVMERVMKKEDTSSSSALPGKLAVGTSRHTILLDLDQITYIETIGSGKGCVIHTLSGETFQDSTSLGEYESRLSNSGFFRIHKTCMVRLYHIQDIFPWGNNSFALHMKGSKKELPIGREKIKSLRNRLNI